MKKHSASSSSWLKKHFSDKYVKKVHKNKLRSRSWFKLKEIQKHHNLFSYNMRVVDLGAAPGGWSKYLTTIIKQAEYILACDILPMEPIFGVKFLQGDLCKPKVRETLLQLVGTSKVNVVLSDMAPNFSGKRIIDIQRSIYLVELALEICIDILATNGSFLVKVFSGSEFDEYLSKIRSLFTKVNIIKLETSFASSSELYIVAKGRQL